MYNMNINFWTERYFQFKSLTYYKRVVSEWYWLKPKANVLIYPVLEKWETPLKTSVSIMQTKYEKLISRKQVLLQQIWYINEFIQSYSLQNKFFLGSLLFCCSYIQSVCQLLVEVQLFDVLCCLVDFFCSKDSGLVLQLIRHLYCMRLKSYTFSVMVLW